MKKLLSLILVLSMMLAFAPAAFAGPAHLDSCSNTSNCSCASILMSAEKESKEIEFVENLKVFLITDCNEEGERLDTIVAEVELPRLYSDKMENQAFLDENEALKEALLGYFEEDKLAENLYRSAGFIHTQLECSFDYLKEVGSTASLEYRIVAADSAKKLILSCPAIEDEMENLTVRAGDILVKLPEVCHNQAFTLALTIEGESAEIELLDEKGAVIEGAEIVK